MRGFGSRALRFVRHSALGAASCTLAGYSTIHNHGSHSDDARIARLEQQVADLVTKLEANGVSQTTGQGDAVFSWDQELTSCFPREAAAYERHMHGGEQCCLAVLGDMHCVVLKASTKTPTPALYTQEVSAHGNLCSGTD